MTLTQREVRLSLLLVCTLLCHTVFTLPMTVSASTMMYLAVYHFTKVHANKFSCNIDEKGQYMTQSQFYNYGIFLGRKTVAFNITKFL